MDANSTGTGPPGDGATSEARGTARRTGTVHFVAAQLAVVVAVIHVGLGALNWGRWLAAGFLVPQDLRWPLFVLSGLLVLGGVAQFYQGARRRPLYVGGIAISLAYVVGYFGWHLGGHRLSLVVGPSTSHDVDVVPFLVDHLFAGAVEFLAIATEVGLAVVLAYLLVVERNS